MKLLLTVFILAVSVCAIAQTNMLPSGVYSPAKAIKLSSDVEESQVLKGTTLDLQTLDIYTITLNAGKTYTLPVDNNLEQLIVVKNGTVSLILKDTAQTVGPGSIALVLAGDQISFKNHSDKPVSWFVLGYQSTNPVNIQRGYNAGPSFIKNWDLLKVNKSVKGETRSLFDRPTSMFERFEIHATALNPGYASHAPHTHRVEEIILMLTGGVLETINQDLKDAHAGDCIYLASGSLHRPINNNNQQCYYLAIQWHNLKTD
ncbi:cupin domain-containing protein [Mucilaginibacter sp. UYCu711]|uniref:cupin domain-containing protein n=1 Tax=Mucilaginibacter sp. UYCu711 TaxID=3156339 RepID=UPI003D20D4AE